MPDGRLERSLCRLLPGAIRRDLFDPARFDLHAERLAARKTGLWYCCQLLRLYAECWRVASIPEFASPSDERTAMFFNDVRFALRSWRREPGFHLLAMVTLALGITTSTIRRGLRRQRRCGSRRPPFAADRCTETDSAGRCRRRCTSWSWRRSRGPASDRKSTRLK